MYLSWLIMTALSHLQKTFAMGSRRVVSWSSHHMGFQALETLRHVRPWGELFIDRPSILEMRMSVLGSDAIDKGRIMSRV